MPNHVYIYIYIYVYIYIEREAVFSVSSVTTNCVLWLLFCSFFVFMHQMMTFQANQTATNLPQTKALWIALAHINVMMQSRSFEKKAHEAFNTNNKRHFSTYFTVDVVSMCTCYWSLFALTNWSWTSGILNTDVLKGYYAHMNQFAQLTAIQYYFLIDPPICLIV